MLVWNGSLLQSGDAALPEAHAASSLKAALNFKGTDTWRRFSRMFGYVMTFSSLGWYINHIVSKWAINCMQWCCDMLLSIITHNTRKISLRFCRPAFTKRTVAQLSTKKDPSLYRIIGEGIWHHVLWDHAAIDHHSLIAPNCRLSRTVGLTHWSCWLT